jgi:ubiquilin
MSTININIKPTAGGSKINLDVDPNATVLELKALLAEKASMPAAEQRLIYKGQILKDEKSLESYGVLPLLLHNNMQHRCSL